MRIIVTNTSGIVRNLRQMLRHIWADIESITPLIDEFNNGEITLDGFEIAMINSTEREGGGLQPGESREYDLGMMDETFRFVMTRLVDFLGGQEHDGIKIINLEEIIEQPIEYPLRRIRHIIQVIWNYINHIDEDITPPIEVINDEVESTRCSEIAGVLNESPEIVSLVVDLLIEMGILTERRVSQNENYISLVSTM